MGFMQGANSVCPVCFFINNYNCLYKSRENQVEMSKFVPINNKVQYK